MKRDKVAAVAGGIIGWGGAGWLIFTGDDQHDVLMQAFLLSVGLISGAWLMLCARNRPMQQAFELGADAGWARGFEAGREAERGAVVGGGRVVRLQGRRRVSV